MDYIQKIFKRVKVKNVVAHLLYGYEPDTEIPDYESRMDVATSLTEVISAVYMEIGFQSGLLFMQEIYHNSESPDFS